ncbi:hypothetical protein GQ54DRAFT_185801 [Martensiomyces pterosporus]|nr:hypothetical protein GQ54DRAFT_185801 [Martensiomyces pterosporus]
MAFDFALNANFFFVQDTLSSRKHPTLQLPVAACLPRSPSSLKEIFSWYRLFSLLSTSSSPLYSSESSNKKQHHSAPIPWFTTFCTRMDYTKCESASDFDTKFRTLLAKLDVVEGEETWQQIDNALKNLLALVKAGATKFDSFTATMKQATNFINNAVSPATRYPQHQEFDGVVNMLKG